MKVSFSMAHPSFDLHFGAVFSRQFSSQYSSEIRRFASFTHFWFSDFGNRAMWSGVVSACWAKASIMHIWDQRPEYQRTASNNLYVRSYEHAMLYEVMWKFGTRNEKRNYVLRSVGGLLISMNFRFISYSYLMELIFPDGLLFFVGRQIV